MDDDLLQRLSKVAQRKVMTKSQVINQILWQYTKWGVFSSSAKLISFPKPLLVRIMDRLSDEEIIEITKQHVEEDVEEIIRLTTGEFTEDKFLEAMELWMKDSEMFYKHEESPDEERYVMNHNMSRNWSLYLGELSRLVIEKLSKKKVELKITDNTATVVIKNPKKS